MGIIRILNLRIPARHGVYEFEKNKEGIFEIDIHMHLDLKNAMLSDNLKDSIDYSKVVELVTKTFSNNNYNLIEYVAGILCEKIFKNYPIEKVIVKIRKPHAPIRADLDTVEVEIERNKKNRK